MTGKEVFLRSLAKKARSMPPGSDPRFPPSEYYRFFKIWTATTKPRLSVELGLCGGGGSYHLATGWPGGTVVGVEHHPGEPEQRANWQFIQERCPNFVLWAGDSIASAPEIYTRYGLVDFLFVDTVHTMERTLAEFNAWRPYLSSRAIVCFDDLYRAGMQEAWDALPGEKLRLDNLHPGSTEGGFGVIWGW